MVAVTPWTGDMRLGEQWGAEWLLRNYSGAALTVKIHVGISTLYIAEAHMYMILSVHQLAATGLSDLLGQPNAIDSHHV